MDVNEIKTKSSPLFISAIEHQNNVKTKKPQIAHSTRNEWYQEYSVGDKFQDRNVTPHESMPWRSETSWRSKPSRSETSWRSKPLRTEASMPGIQIAAIEAVSQGWLEEDVRPKIYDNVTKTWTLCDSGSVVTCIPRKPGDTIDNNIKLRYVNGGSIPTFGSEELVIRLGRKSYKIQAIKADIPQRILGWDFFKKFKLNLECRYRTSVHIP